MTRCERLHAFKSGAASAKGEEGEEMVETTRVRLRRHTARGDQSFDLGPEIDQVALARPEQRANPHPVARQQHGPPLEVDQREGELTFEVLEELLAILFIEMDDDLAVAMGPEDMTLGFKLRPPLREIEQLAITDDDDTFVLVEDRLMPVAQADNAEAPIGDPDARGDEEAVIIRPTMMKRIRHTLEHRLIGTLPSFQVQHSGYAAHRASFAPRAS